MPDVICLYLCPCSSQDNLTSWVLVNNKVVEILAVKAKGLTGMTCYICTPSSTDTAHPTQPVEFAVGFRDDRPPSYSAPDLLVECVVDGVAVKHDEVVIRALKEGGGLPFRRNDSSRSQTWRGRKESATVIRPFVFAPLKLTEDEDLACSSESIVRQLGTIQLRVYRGTITSEAARTVEDDQYKAEIDVVEEMVFEESFAKVKGGGVSHQAGLGPARPVGYRFERSVFEMSSDDSDQNPYMTFEFVYRSREVLELNGILPPQTSTTLQSTSSSTSSASTSSASSSSSSFPNPTPPSSAVVPKDRPNSADPRTDARVLPPTRRIPEALPSRPPRSATSMTTTKQEELNDDDAETKRRILKQQREQQEQQQQIKRGKKQNRIEKKLGMIILSDSSDDDHDTDITVRPTVKQKGKGKGKEKEVQGRECVDLTMSSPQQLKPRILRQPLRPQMTTMKNPNRPSSSSSTVSKSKVTIRASTTTETQENHHQTNEVERNDHDQLEEDQGEESEIVRLRREIAFLKRQRQLTELRKERDELARLTRLDDHDHGETSRSFPEPYSSTHSASSREEPDQRVAQGGEGTGEVPRPHDTEEPRNPPPSFHNCFGTRKLRKTQEEEFREEQLVRKRIRMEEESRF